MKLEQSTVIKALAGIFFILMALAILFGLTGSTCIMHVPSDGKCNVNGSYISSDKTACIIPFPEVGVCPAGMIKRLGLIENLLKTAGDFFTGIMIIGIIGAIIIGVVYLYQNQKSTPFKDPDFEMAEANLRKNQKLVDTIAERRYFDIRKARVGTIVSGSLSVFAAQEFVPIPVGKNNYYFKEYWIIANAADEKKPKIKDVLTRAEFAEKIRQWLRVKERTPQQQQEYDLAVKFEEAGLAREKDEDTTIIGDKQD